MNEPPPKPPGRSIFRAQAIASTLGDSEDGTPDILARPPWRRLLIGGCLLVLAVWLWP